MPRSVCLSDAEVSACRLIAAKVENLKAVLQANDFREPINAHEWLAHLTAIKESLGNVGNSMSYLATLLVKEFLQSEYGVTDFDAAAKPQGAAGADVIARAVDGRSIIGELKTTKPFQPGFGAAQRASMLKDLARLSSSQADVRLMFVTDPDAYDALKNRKTFASAAPGVLLVDLVSPRRCTLGMA